MYDAVCANFCVFCECLFLVVVENDTITQKRELWSTAQSLGWVIANVKPLGKLYGYRIQIGGSFLEFINAGNILYRERERDLVHCIHILHTNLTTRNIFGDIYSIARINLHTIMQDVYRITLEMTGTSLHQNTEAGTVLVRYAPATNLCKCMYLWKKDAVF